MINIIYINELVQEVPRWSWNTLSIPSPHTNLQTKYYYTPAESRRFLAIARNDRSLFGHRGKRNGDSLENWLTDQIHLANRHFFSPLSTNNFVIPSDSEESPNPITVLSGYESLSQGTYAYKDIMFYDKLTSIIICAYYVLLSLVRTARNQVSAMRGSAKDFLISSGPFDMTIWIRKHL